uniref:Putative secreted mucin n=1 Tax=Corethrella appendiculata TaxID=1370023 RepID=U5EPT2_9DIPT
MKQNILIIVVIALTISTVNCQPEYTSGFVLVENRNRFLSNNQQQSCAALGNPEKNGVVCDSCYDYKGCAKGNSLEVLPCAKNQFCIPGVDGGNAECSFTQRSECIPRSIPCTVDDDYLPDPYNCTHYHFCRKGANNSIKLSCPSGYSFNAYDPVRGKECQRNFCSNLECSPNTLARYEKSKKYYAYCQTHTIVMFKCPKNYNFNGTNCEFVCPDVGNFPHENSRYKIPNNRIYDRYYWCDESYMPVVRFCEENEYFNNEFLQCLTREDPVETPSK